jgi:hypothetical protein
MGMEEGMRGGGVGRQKDRQRTPVSFAIVSDHLPSFSILWIHMTWQEIEKGESEMALARMVTIRPLMKRGITHLRSGACLNQGGRDRDRADRGKRRVEWTIGIERRRSVRLPFRHRTQGDATVHETLLDIRAKLIIRIGLTGIRIACAQRRGITGGPCDRTNGDDRRQDGRRAGHGIGAGSRNLLFIDYNVTRIHSTAELENIPRE